MFLLQIVTYYNEVDKLSPLRRDLGQLEYESCTIKVMNKRRRFINRTAKNCIPWLLLDTGRCCRLAWVGGDRTTTLNLNVGDAAEVDLCAMITKSGNIYAPSCLLPSSHPIFIGNGTKGLSGVIAISSTNAKRARKNIVLYSYERATSSGSFQTLAVNLEKPARVEKPHNISDWITRGTILFTFAGLGIVYTSGWVKWLSWSILGFSALLIAMATIQFLMLKVHRFAILTRLWEVSNKYTYQFISGSSLLAAFFVFYISFILRYSEIPGIGGQFFFYIGLVWSIVVAGSILKDSRQDKKDNNG